MRPSRFLRYREREGRFLIFHELHPFLIEVSEKMFIALKRNEIPPNSAFSATLQQHGLLIEKSSDDEVELKRARDTLIQRLDIPVVLYLRLIRGCNFACEYCPVPEQARAFGDATMTKELAEDAIEFWLKSLDKVAPDAEATAIFYGGEPLLNRTVFEHALEYLKQQTSCRSKPQRITSMVVTNGSILDDSLMTKFRDYQVTVVVGLDGPEIADNLLRNLTKEAPSFKVVIANVERMLKNGVDVCLSCALTPGNLNRAAGFGKGFKSLGARQFGFNLLRGKNLLQLIGRPGLEDYYAKAVDCIVGSYQTQGDDSFEHQMSRRQMAFRGQPFFPTDCFAYGNQIVVHPDGTVNNCPFVPHGDHKLRTLVNYEEFLQSTQVQNFRKRLPLFNPLCQECDAKSICGGGCGWNTTELYDDQYAIDEGACLLSKSAFEVFIEVASTRAVRP